MATKKTSGDCGGHKPIAVPRMKGDKDPNKPMNEQKKTTPTKKKVKRSK